LFYSKHVFVCTNQKGAGKVCCANHNTEAHFDYLKGRLLELECHGPEQIRVSKTGCLGRCASGPCMVIYPEGTWYRAESEANIDEIIEQHLLEDNVVEHLIIET